MVGGREHPFSTSVSRLSCVIYCGIALPGRIQTPPLLLHQVSSSGLLWEGVLLLIMALGVANWVPRMNGCSLLAAFYLLEVVVIAGPCSLGGSPVRVWGVSFSFLFVCCVMSRDS